MDWWAIDALELYHKGEEAVKWLDIGGAEDNFSRLSLVTIE